MVGAPFFLPASPCPWRRSRLRLSRRDIWDPAAPDHEDETIRPREFFPSSPPDVHRGDWQSGPTSRSQIIWRGYPGPRISRRDRLPLTTDGPSHRSLPFEDYRSTYQNEAAHEVRLSHPCERVPEIGPGFSGEKIPKRRSRLCGWDLSDPTRIGRIHFGLLLDWSVLIFSMFPFPGSYHFGFVKPRAIDVKFEDPGGSAFILRVCVIG